MFGIGGRVDLAVTYLSASEIQRRNLLFQAL
jgi:hypothetical protein